MHVRSKMEAVSKLYVHLTRVDVMGSTKGIAGVEEIACVGNVYCIGRCHPLLSKAFSDGQIEGGVRRQVSRPISVEEARAELIGRRGPDSSRQSQVQDRGCRVALIVIQKEVAGRHKFQQAAGDGTDALRNLVGVGDA